MKRPKEEKVAEVTPVKEAPRDTLAVVVIATTDRRETTFPKVMDSILAQKPDELVVVADFDWPSVPPWRHLCVNAVTKTTIDALMKRDVGWAATTANTVLFLTDDHRLTPDFLTTYHQKYSGGDWDFMAPTRHTIRDGKMISLNIGMNQKYVSGHAGFYRRRCATLLPWMATLHHKNWDFVQSHHLLVEGARLRYAEIDLAVEDIEGGEPWR